MRQSFKTGFSFGLTSGVITTLGLMVGLHAGTHSLAAVVGGIVTIAIADALSDALGIHIAEESRADHPVRAVWESTFATLVSKAVIGLTFLVPLWLLPLDTAVIAAIAWGLLLLYLLSHRLAWERGVSPWGVVGEHLAIGILVVLSGHYVGGWAAGLVS